MRHPQRTLLAVSSTLLFTLALLSHQASFSQARAIATYDSTNSNGNSDSPHWKRESHGHSPYSNPAISPGGALQGGDVPSGNTGGTTGPTRKRSLFSVDENTRAQDADRVRVVHSAFQQSRRPFHRRLPTEIPEEPEAQYVNVDLWEESDDDEVRTLIEPQYPSLDLFDEEDEELFDIGDDDTVVEIGNKKTADRSTDNLTYMVDEWEEELETDMDELMDWVEDDHILSRHAPERKKNERVTKPQAPVPAPGSVAEVMGSHRLRDQASVRDVLVDEDEASPFQRIFSESWLF
ncbi:hypothetical protein BGZ75_003185 [Mortierella antarctica]|nr:hypothetical protein BGZ75_003185 [Mortierella antarctica]